MKNIIFCKLNIKKKPWPTSEQQAELDNIQYLSNYQLLQQQIYMLDKKTIRWKCNVNFYRQKCL